MMMGRRWGAGRSESGWRTGLLPAGMLLSVSLAVTGCGLFGGDDDEEVLTGERVSVLSLEPTIEPDPRVRDLEVVVPDPLVLTDWPQTGGTPSHSVGNLAVGLPLDEAWTRGAGAGGGGVDRLLSSPIVARGVIYVPDARGAVTALEAASGRELWRVRVATPEEDGTPLGGGVAFADGILYATTGYGEILALDPANGGLIWRAVADAPIRATPSVADGRVFAVTVDNELEVYDAATGALLWDHAGIVETEALLGAANPAIGQGGTVIVPYSSGEVFALRAETGRTLWSDSLAAVRRFGAVAGLGEVRGLPVIDDDIVFAGSNSGRFVALDVRTGARVWEEAIPTAQTPWVAGDFVFVLTTDDELVALTRDGGAIRWVTELPRLRDRMLGDVRVQWIGPVMVANRLIVTGSDGTALFVSPFDGAILGEADLEGTPAVPPIVVDGVMYTLNQNGTVTAYRSAADGAIGATPVAERPR